MNKLEKNWKPKIESLRNAGYSELQSVIILASTLEGIEDYLLKFENNEARMYFKWGDKKSQLLYIFSQKQIEQELSHRISSLYCFKFSGINWCFTIKDYRHIGEDYIVLGE